VLTSRDGDFRFVAMPQGTYALRSRRAAPLGIGPFHGTIPVTLPFGGLGEYLPGVTIAPADPPPAAGSATITGVLRDERGRALGGATVIVRGLRARAPVVAVRTDGDGRYRAENLPPGRYRVSTGAGPHRGRASDRAHVGAGGSAHLDLTAARS
jgi:hypothetical protein